MLDFGLAKAIAEENVRVDISASPTISHMSTQAGIILGTAAYMSPEQAKGRAVDRRAGDIWAFGCVLLEMLTGRMAFGGETLTDTLAAVVIERTRLGAASCIHSQRNSGPAATLPEEKCAAAVAGYW